MVTLGGHHDCDLRVVAADFVEDLAQLSNLQGHHVCELTLRNTCFFFVFFFLQLSAGFYAPYPSILLVKKTYRRGDRTHAPEHSASSCTSAQPEGRTCHGHSAEEGSRNYLRKVSFDTIRRAGGWGRAWNLPVTIRLHSRSIAGAVLVHGYGDSGHGSLLCARSRMGNIAADHHGGLLESSGNLAGLST